MASITPSLWFDGCAEQAAQFYASVFPGGQVDFVQRAPADNPSTSAGQVLLVGFTLHGQSFIGINGGPQFRFTEAVSFQIRCDSQEQADTLWDALVAEGGEHSQCGWLKDRFGLSWQVIPPGLDEVLGGPDPAGAARAMTAMLEMTRLDMAVLRAAYDGREA